MNKNHTSDGFRQHDMYTDQVDQDENITINLISDEEEDTPQPQPPPLKAQPNYYSSVNFNARDDVQMKKELFDDSEHHDVSAFASYRDFTDDQPQNDDAFTYEQTSDGEDFLNDLKNRHHYKDQMVQYSTAQTGSSFQMNMTQMADSTAAASPTMVTSTTAPMTTAAAAAAAAAQATPSSTSPPPSLPSHAPTVNYNAEPQSQFETYADAIHTEFDQNLRNNLALDEVFQNSVNETIPVAQLIESKVAEYMKKAMQQLTDQYHLVPKNSATNKRDWGADLKSKKPKRQRQPKKERTEQYSDSSSSPLDDLFGPSTSTPKHSGGKNSRYNETNSFRPRGANKKEPKLRFGNDFQFGRPTSAKMASSKPTYTTGTQKKPTDYGIVKNDNKSLYMVGKAALKCPLCNKQYKRMVSHFKNVHHNYEVFVSRLSQQMATTLIRSQLATHKYTRASGIHHLKMMCPFCECEKDFFIPYWNNHIRTHTGEYTNECVVCGKISLNATHCAQPTIKQKCNLFENGLSAFICLRCNWVQIDEKSLIKHVKTQHGINAGCKNEYERITIIPALKQIHTQNNPNNILVQASTTHQHRPQFAADHRASTSASSSGIQILHEVVLEPGILNLNAGAGLSSVHDDNDSIYNMLNNSQTDVSSFHRFDDLYTQANQIDDDDDIEMMGELPSGQSNGSNIDMIKVDAIDESTLQNISRGYNENDTNVLVVRPWIEDDYARKFYINEISQFALYKCMHEKCIFVTNSNKDWQIHMGAHHHVIDHFQKNNMLVKMSRDRLIKFRECAYCGFEAKADHQVIRHMLEDHQRSIFQCSDCFYRSIEMDNMVLHMKAYHPENNTVLLCGDSREFLQQDEEILSQDCDNYVLKIKCGQGGCSEEYVCYNSLYAHLTASHPGLYVCPECSQSMGLDEALITEHFSKYHKGFEEFQCLRCFDGFHTVQELRQHMSLEHPSYYLFAGARRTRHPDEEQDDEIQVIYVGNAENSKPYKLIKCTEPAVLNAMDPKQLELRLQLDQLRKLQMEYPSLKAVHTSPVPRIEKSDKITLEFMQYSEYYATLNERQDKKRIPLLVTYKCITNQLLNDMPSIAEHIDRSKDIDLTGCKSTEYTGPMLSILRHQCRNHQAQQMVFLQIDQQLPFTVKKIVRCTFQCQSCSGTIHTRTELLRHFRYTHLNHWIAAKMLVTTKVIETNDPNQPIGLSTANIEYFYCQIFKCAQIGCNSEAGTRTQVIEHYNDVHHHNSVGSSIDAFEAILAEHIIPYEPQRIEPFVRENEIAAHQMYLFECQHCWRLFESLNAINAHFATVRVQNAHTELRFVVKQLYRCLEDNAVRTFAGMKQHASRHPENQSIVPVNMHMPTVYCGLCNYNHQKNGNLSAHFEEKHGGVDGDMHKDVFLNSLKLSTNLMSQIDINQCKFASGCCTNDECNLLRQIVEHVLTCNRRFVCNQCKQQTFSCTTSFVHHCKEHDPNVDVAQIVDDLHNFKAFLSLFANMQIILPNGLVLVMREIRDTAFGYEIQGKIGTIAQQSWQQEKSDLSLLIML